MEPSKSIDFENSNEVEIDVKITTKQIYLQIFRGGHYLALVLD